MPPRLTFKIQWLARYAAALAAVGVGLLVRLGLTALVGEGLPTYITFYPVIMAAALLGGFGPGLLATLATALAVDYWVLPPTHAFGIASLVDVVGLAFFVGMGVFMSAVAALYRRARHKEVAFDTGFFRPEGQGLPRRPRAETAVLVSGLVLALAILGIIGWKTYGSLAATTQADRWVSHTYRVNEELEHLFSTLGDMESSARGYLITGAEDDLRPYNAARQTVAAQLASLKRLAAGNPNQTKRLKGIEALMDAKMGELKETIEVRRSQGLEAVHNLMAAGKGRALSDDIRRQMTETQEEEMRLLGGRTGARDAAVRRTSLEILAGGVLSLTLLTTVFLFLMQENHRRRLAEAELRRHGDDLQKTVDARTTELREANASLGKSERQFRTLADSIPNLAWSANGDGYISWYNRRWYEYTGTTPQEMEGWGWQSVHDPQTLPAVLERWKASIATGQVFDMTFPLRGADGVFRPFLTRGFPLKDAQGRVQQWFGTNTDVSAQKLAEEAYARLAAIIESSDDAILSKDLGGTITSWNVAAERLFGYTAGEAIGRSIRLLLPSDRQDEEDQIMARLQAGQRIEHFETVRLTKAGRGLAVSVTSSPLKDSEGRIIGASKIIRDITERERAEEAERQLNAELQQRVADLQAANEEVQASRRAALSLAEDAQEARKESERTNANLKKAYDSLEVSRRAAVNLMDDSVRARKLAEKASAELMRANRALKARSHSDQALLRANVEAEFLEEVCRIVVEDCGHAMVWIGFAEEDEAKTVRPVAQAGFEAGYLGTLKITWADTERGRGPTGTAIRTGQPTQCRHMLTDPAFAPWREEAIRRGYASSIALPLLAEGRAIGALTIYSALADGFGQEETALLAELAGDLAYGITALRVRAAKEQAEAALRQTTEDLTRSNRDLEQFAYVASHDLQEPLRAVGGYVKLLQHRFPDKLDAKAQGYINGAFDGATRMEQLIHDLLAFSRVATRGDALLPADLADALAQALSNLEVSIKSAQARISHDPLPTLAVDAGQIRQLFQNLIGNAIKFQGDQSPEIHIGAQRSEGRWVFSVRDNGIGIEPQYFEKIFHIFQRLHTRKDYAGTGIGLAICKRIVERHGGSIWVESQPGQGSTFYFSIPETAAKMVAEEAG